MTKPFKQSLYILLGLLMALALCNKALAQESLTIDCTMLKNNKQVHKDSAKFIIKVVDENNDKIEWTCSKGFKVDLAYDHKYRIIFYYPGCQPKFIYFNTTTKNKAKLKYMFAVNLIESDKTDLINAGGIYYDLKINQFDYYINK